MSKLEEIKLRVNKEDLARWQELARKQDQILTELIVEIMNDYDILVQQAEEQDQLFNLKINK